jgi:hypothetical protein
VMRVNHRDEGKSSFSGWITFIGRRKMMKEIN